MHPGNVQELKPESRWKRRARSYALKHRRLDKRNLFRPEQHWCNW